MTRWITFGVAALVGSYFAQRVLSERFGFDIGPQAAVAILAVICAVAGFMAARRVGTVRSGAITGVSVVFIYLVIVSFISAGRLSAIRRSIDDPGLAMTYVAAVALLFAAIGVAAGALGAWVAVLARPPAPHGGTRLIDAARLQEGQRVRIGYRDESSETDLRGQVLRVGPDASSSRRKSRGARSQCRSTGSLSSRPSKRRVCRGWPLTVIPAQLLPWL